VVSILPRRGSGPSDDPELRHLRERVDDLDAQRRADALAVLRGRVDRSALAAQEAELRTACTPCSYCGRDRASGEGRWGGFVCHDCNWERRYLTDTEFRSWTLHRVIGDPPGRFTTGRNATRELRKSGFVWWSESGAKPGGWSRFAYLSVESLKAAMAEAPPDLRPTYHGGDACSRCGCRFLWRTDNPVVTQVVMGRLPTDPHQVHDVQHPDPVCGGCIGWDYEAIATRVIGLRPDSRSDWRQYVYWFSDRPQAQRVSESAKIFLSPFAYLPLDQLRHRAFTTTHIFESMWSRPEVYAALIQRYGNPIGVPLTAPMDEDDE